MNDKVDNSKKAGNSEQNMRETLENELTGGEYEKEKENKK